MELTPFSCVLLHLRGVFLCLRLRQAILGSTALAWSFVLWFGGAFSFLWIWRSKVPLLLFKLLLNLDSVPIRRVERGNVQELHLLLDVLVQIAMVLEHKMSLSIIDTQLHAKGMENICELQHILVLSLPQRGQLYVFILILGMFLSLYLEDRYIWSWTEDNFFSFLSVLFIYVQERNSLGNRISSLVGFSRDRLKE